MVSGTAGRAAAVGGGVERRVDLDRLRDDGVPAFPVDIHHGKRLGPGDGEIDADGVVQKVMGDGADPRPAREPWMVTSSQQSAPTSRAALSRSAAQREMASRRNRRVKARRPPRSAPEGRIA